MQQEQVSLFFTEGGSDKVYQAQLIASGDGFVVNFQYGRRGSALKAGTKTDSPLPYEAAKKTYDKLVKEKTSKGYTPDESGSAFQGTEKAGNKTDFVPQLLNAISEDEAMRLIKDDDWAAQEKMDGERRAVDADGVNATGMNRKGLSVPLPQVLADELNAIASSKGAFRADAEIIGDKLYVFDLHVHAGESIRQTLGWLERMVLAKQLFAGCKNIIAVSVARTTEEKRALWDKVKAAHGEGIVFKRIDSLVTEGRPNSGGAWLKFKFVESATCIVTGNNGDKRSVAIGLLGKPGSGSGNVGGGILQHGTEIIPVGNVTIPANYDMPVSGNLVEVEYLYAYKGGSLYQPVYRGKRTDINFNACVLGQLKFKPEGREEEDSSDA